MATRLRSTLSRVYDSISPVVSMTSTSPDSTRTAPIPVIVTFSKPVTGFVSTEILITNGTLSNFTGSNDSYAFNLNPSGQGTVTATIAANVAQDSAGNWNTAAAAFIRVYDTIAPTVIIDLQDGSDSGILPSDNLTNVASPVFNAVFSEPVMDFNSSDLSNTGTASGCSFGIGTPAGNTYPVTVTSCSGGTVIIRLAANGITDVAGNPNLVSSSPVVTIDRDAPAVIFDLQSLSDSGISNSDDLTNALVPVFDARFNEPIFELLPANFTNAGTAGGCSFLIGSPVVNTYPLSLSTCTDGTIVLRLAAAQISDAAGNMNAQTLGPTVTIDRTAPAFSGVTPAANGFINSVTSSSDVGYGLTESIVNGSLSIIWTGGVNDPAAHICNLIGSALTIGSHTNLDLSDTVNGCQAAQSLVSNATYTFGFTGSDAAGNPAVQINRTNVTFDNTVPTITLSAPSAASTKNGPVTFTVIYSDLNFNASTLSAGNITLNKFPNENETIDGTISVDSGIGSTRTITVSNITPGNGTLGISIAAGTASDKAGNLAPASGASATFIVDNTPPTIFQWPGPGIENGGYYIVRNQTVQLEVEVDDSKTSSGINRVVFYRWCPANWCLPTPGLYLEIGRVTSSPYRILFDASVLTLPGPNQFDAYVFDNAGNFYKSTIWLNHIPTVIVHKSGDGEGTVSSLDSHIDCGSTCAYGYDVGTQVTLTATPVFPSTFTGWSGACTGMGTCRLTMSEDKTVTANFS